MMNSLAERIFRSKLFRVNLGLEIICDILVLVAEN